MRNLTGSMGRNALVAILAVSGLAALAAQPVSAAQDDLDLVSRATGAAGAKAEENADQAVISADGRFVAFRSPANNLHADDEDSTVDVYVRDLQNNTTALVSRATTATGDPGNNTSDQPAISADGRYVAFASTATNLHPDDTDSIDDVFVRDLQNNTTTLVSRATDATGAKSDSQSRSPSISAEGSSVAFRSTGANLHPDDTDGNADIFVRDLSTDTTTLVSRATDATGAKGNGNSGNAAISADGSSVAFESVSNNLHPDDTDTTLDVFVRDLQDNTTTLVSRATGATGAKGGSSSDLPAISADGRFVAFQSAATSLHADDLDTTRDIFLRDLQDNTTTLVSRAAGDTGDAGNDESSTAAISDDGQSVAFQSSATNLHPDDTDTIYDVFVRDLLASTTTLVSRSAGATGIKSNGNSFAAAISADKRYVAFVSTATNLHPDDTDTQNDVLRRDLLGPTTPPPTSTCFGFASTIEGTEGTETIEGTAGNDVIVAKGGNDLILSRGGNDIICGGAGNDRIYGGSGNDVLAGEAGNDTLTGGTGADRLSGGDGSNDRASYYDHTSSVAATIGNGKFDDGNGTDGPSGARDQIYYTVEGLIGGAGNDSLVGSGISNTIIGADGNDTLAGLSGDDTLHGSAGDDTVRGGYGRDSVYGGTGVDSLYGEGDADILYAKDNTRDMRLDGGTGRDLASRDAADPPLISVP